MGLLTKTQTKQLQKQFAMGSDLSKQKVITKIFNPYGSQRWYLLNQDPEDPDYLWVIFWDGDILEMGSASLYDLETARVGKWRLPLERDKYFSPINAEEVFQGLGMGRFYEDGGEIDVKIVNKDRTFTELDYKGIFGDYDKDGIPNVDDPNPTAKGDKGPIEKEISFADVFSNLLDSKKSWDKAMDRVVAKLKQIAPLGSKIYARTKTPFSVIKKLTEKRMVNLKQTKGDSVIGLTDIIGTTIAVKDYEDLVALRKKIEGGALGKIFAVDDFYEAPKDGYRAFHCTFIEPKSGLPVELQLKTQRQKLINTASHTPYKQNNLDVEQLLYLTDLANEADMGNIKAIREFNRETKDMDKLKASLYLKKSKNS